MSVDCIRIRPVPDSILDCLDPLLFQHFEVIAHGLELFGRVARPIRDLTGHAQGIYGLGISLVLVLIRVYGGLPEGVMYSILFMNAFVPLINRYTQPKIFGEGKA